MLLTTILAGALLQTEGLVREAEALGEQVRTITTMIAEMRDKNLVHEEALAEVEAFMAQITGQGGNLAETARRIEEHERQLQAKKREVEILERDYETAKGLYDATDRRIASTRAEIDRRTEANRRAIDAHNALKDRYRSDAEREEYNRNAERLNREKDAISNMIDNFNNVLLPAARDESARLRQKDDRMIAVDKDRYNLETSLKKELRAFRERLESMKNPSEQLLAVLREATKPSAAAAGYATFGEAAAAAASPFPQAYGSAAGIAADIAGEIWVIRRARDRSTNRDYLVQKLRLGMLARTLAGYAAAPPQADLAASRAFSETRATASPLVARSAEASWTLPVRVAPRPRSARAPIGEE
jgi:hypothetical protein